MKRLLTVIFILSPYGTDVGLTTSVCPASALWVGKAKKMKRASKDNNIFLTTLS